jgi:molybdate transport system substrate-binding protein
MKRRGWTSIITLVFVLFMACLAAYPQFGFAKDMLLVYSGAGMRKPMDEIGPLFEQKYGVAVKYNYAGSGQLLSQMELTKQGDVYQPGATYYFNIAKRKGFIDYEKFVACHIPVIAVPEGNPAKITCLNDLTRPGIKVALGDSKACAIGKLRNKILEKNGIKDAVDKNVILRAVTVNELIVYVSMRQVDAAITWEESVFFAPKETDIIEVPKE